MVAPTREETVVPRTELLGARGAEAEGEVETDGTKALGEQPRRGWRPDGSATGDGESKWTRRTTSAARMGRGVNATAAVARGGGDDALLAAMVLLLVKWRMWAM